MDHFHLDQTRLRAITGWSRRKASTLFTGEQPYKRDSLNEAAAAMNLHPVELLMHPDDAYAIRKWRAEIEREAVRLVAERGPNYQPPPSDADHKQANG